MVERTSTPRRISEEIDGSRRYLGTTKFGTARFSEKRRPPIKKKDPSQMKPNTLASKEHWELGTQRLGSMQVGCSFSKFFFVSKPL